MLIDGHNRFEICTRLGIDYQTVQIDFADRSYAVEWIIKNQFGRRNLIPYIRVTLALQLEQVISDRAKANQAHGQTAPGVTLLTNSSKAIEPINTRAVIAKNAGVAEDTVAKVKAIESTGSPELKQAVRTGEVSINLASQFVALPKEKQAEALSKIDSKAPTDLYRVSR